MAKSKKKAPAKSAPAKKAPTKKTPAKKAKASAPKLPKSLRKGALPKAVDQVWAAGIGALDQARKQGAEVFDALVERGEHVAKKGSDAAKSALGDVEAAASQMTGRVRSTADDAVDGLQDRVERAVEAALATIGLPKRDEISALRMMVDSLQARLESLDLVGAPEAAADVTVYELVPHAEGWAIQKPGAARALSVVKTKKEALRDARQTARDHAPSRLTVYNLDGSAGETTDYDA